MKSKKQSKPGANSKFADTEIQHIEHLLNFMTEHNLEEFEYSRGDLKIRLKKPSANLAMATARQFAAPEIIMAGAAQPQTSAPAAPPPAAKRSPEAQDLAES